MIPRTGLAFIGLSLVLSTVLLVLLPFMFAELMVAGLTKLHLSPETAISLTFAVMIGGFINIPIRRIPNATAVPLHPLALFGITDAWPELRQLRTETILAVNVGGCIVPAGIAMYEIFQLAALDPGLLLALAISVLLNIAICYFLARPVPGVGIALPVLVPAVVTAVVSLMLAPDQAPPVAFVSGVAGPLVGADLLHLRTLDRVPAGLVSIGGAGTFDGIVLSGIVAAYLA